MPRGKKHGKKKTPSAATILSTSDVNVNNNKEAVLPSASDEKAVEMIVTYLTKHADQFNTIVSAQCENRKQVEELQSACALMTKKFGNLVGTIENITSIVKQATKDVADLQMLKLGSQLKQPTSPHQNKDIAAQKAELQQLRNENLALKSEMQQLKKENSALRSGADSLKGELRTLKDDFLLNLDRQHEDTLVIHGILEKEGESEQDLQEKVNQIVAPILNSNATCTEALRLGKKGQKPRVVKVRWENQKHCRTILEQHRNLPKGIYINKDRPFVLREIKRRIRDKAKTLWDNNIDYEYKDLGLIYNGKFHHYTEFVPSPSN